MTEIQVLSYVYSKRRRNRIEQLKDDKGCWIKDANRFKTLAVQLFSGLFTQSFSPPFSLCIPNMFPHVDFDSLNATLITLVPKVVNP